MKENERSNYPNLATKRQIIRNKQIQIERKSNFEKKTHFEKSQKCKMGRAEIEN